MPNSVALINDVYLKEIYSTHFATSPRDFIAATLVFKNTSNKQRALKDTLKRLTKTNKTITIEALKALLGNTQAPFANNAIVDDKTTQLAKAHLAELNTLIN